MGWEIAAATIALGLAGLGGIIWLARSGGASGERAKLAKEQQQELDRVVRALSRRRRRGRDLLERMRRRKGTDRPVS